MPTRPITVLSEETMDDIAAVRLPEDLTISFPKLAVTYPEGIVLDRAQQLALRIINDSSRERSIFFSSSAGLMTELGLEPWGVRHGLTTKLELRNLETDPGVGLVRGSPEYGADWYDLDQSLELYQDVYLFRGILDQDVWADRSTLMIPWQYYVMALQLSDVVAVDGRDPALTRSLVEDAATFQVVAQGGPHGTPEAIEP